jgi:hypothetical protein
MQTMKRHTSMSRHRNLVDPSSTRHSHQPGSASVRRFLHPITGETLTKYTPGSEAMISASLTLDDISVVYWLLGYSVVSGDQNLRK